MISNSCLLFDSFVVKKVACKMSCDRLTERKFWDDYWDGLKIPAEIKRSDTNFLLNEELNVFEKYLPKKTLSAIEIGGAPGQYLAYLKKEFGYKIHSLDYSEKGCEKTIENFKLLGIQGEVFQKDLFSDLSGLPEFDLVFSMGFIEHFEDLKLVIKKHLILLKPGGILMIGMPNYRGINRFFLKHLAPENLSMHNLKTMDIKTWKDFEKELNLKPVFKGYIGGFEPMTFLLRENKNYFSNLLFFIARTLNFIFHSRLKFLRKFNSVYTSGYIFGIYNKQD